MGLMHMSGVLSLFTSGPSSSSIPLLSCFAYHTHSMFYQCWAMPLNMCCTTVFAVFYPELFFLLFGSLSPILVWLLLCIWSKCFISFILANPVFCTLSTSTLVPVHCLILVYSIVLLFLL